MHPNATSGKRIIDLVTIRDALIDLLDRKYNTDALYRDLTDAPFRKIYKGDPWRVESTPSIAVIIEKTYFDDAPQDSGSDGEISWKLQYYAKESRREEIQDETLRVAMTIKQIIMENPTIPGLDGTDYVADIGPRVDLDFDKIIDLADFGKPPVETAIIRFTSIFAETGF